jgi:YVTN family beta-propeller protein
MSHLWFKLKQFFFPSNEAEDRAQKLAEAIEDAQSRAEETKDLAVKVWYHAKVDHLQRKWTILALQGERRRITAWDRIQEKKKAGKYPTFCSDSICFDGSFAVLEIVLMFLEAETNEDWQTMAYVTNSGSHTVSVIATANHAVIATIPVKLDPRGVAITPNGTKVYVANWHGNTVSVIATDNYEVIATISVGISPNGVAITPDGTKAYVVNSHSGTVSVIVTDNYEVIATIPVETSPREVAITPNGTKVYVTNFHSKTVSVIATDTNEVATILQSRLDG